MFKFVFERKVVGIFHFLISCGLLQSKLRKLNRKQKGWSHFHQNTCSRSVCRTSC